MSKVQQKLKQSLNSLRKGILKIDETVQRTAQIYAALIALPLMLKDDQALLFREDTENDDIRTPQIITYLPQTHSGLFIEGEIIDMTDDFLYAFFMMFASYYVLNLQYSSSIEAILSYFQKFIVGIGYDG